MDIALGMPPGCDLGSFLAPEDEVGIGALDIVFGEYVVALTCMLFPRCPEHPEFVGYRGREGGSHSLFSTVSFLASRRISLFDAFINT
jgi:hypothetical protein